MKKINSQVNTNWSINIGAWMLIVGIAIAVGFMFYDGLNYMVQSWSREEYSHGYLLPVVSIFLIWQKRNQIAQIEFSENWLGLVIVLIGISFFLAGNLSTIYVIIQYAFMIVLAGLLLAFMGWRGFKIIFVPVLVLLFMIPLPDFIYYNLSSELQLISSQLGVYVIRLFGISVFLEGNVIDLGNYQLQVVEACNGLRYLFPLMSFGFICAYLFKAPFWQRTIIFLSTIPITVFMNSFRIGVIGVLVDRWGIEQAQGFLHDFEGWIIFMACTAILFLEMWLFVRFRKEKRPLLEVFGLEVPASLSKDAEIRSRPVPKPFIASAIVLVLAAMSSYGITVREEIIPDRIALDQFPSQIGEWKGKEDKIKDIYLDVLKLSEYYLGDFSNPAGDAVNFYVAYYKSQRSGESAHSPRSCIPGGGWRITTLTQHQLEGADINGLPRQVNRLQIQRGEYKQLVYYWFQQRGRVITNEYLVKWFLFWDSLTRNRSDGALVRLTTSIGVYEDWSKGDARLTEFVRAVADELTSYIPE